MHALIFYFRLKLERVEKVLDTMKLRPEYANMNYQRPKVIFIAKKNKINVNF